jgi:hypothetical protein
MGKETMSTNQAATLLQRAIEISATANARVDIAFSEIQSLRTELNALIVLLHAKTVLTETDIQTLIPALADLQSGLAARQAGQQKPSFDSPPPLARKKKPQ